MKLISSQNSSRDNSPPLIDHNPDSHLYPFSTFFTANQAPPLYPFSMFCTAKILAPFYPFFTFYTATTNPSPSSEFSGIEKGFHSCGGKI